MLPTISIAPFQQAVDRAADKTAVASVLRTKDWAQVPLGLRDRAFFSAGVDDLNTVQLLKGKLGEALSFLDREPDRAFMDRSKFVSEVRQAIGAEEGDTGDLTDLSSQRRLELIYDFQVQDAAEFGRWKIGQDPDLLDAYPAQEFLRIESRRVPRQDWPERWVAAGGQIFDGRMIALKNDPVWTRLSRFGRPWPPFDFGSGMGIEDIGRDEAEQLGLISPGETVPPTEGDFNDGLTASVTDLDPDLVNKLGNWFGDQVEVKEGVAQWRE